VTIDAIGTQAKIMEQIKGKKAEFVLPLKKNQRGSFAKAERFFEQYNTQILQEVENYDALSLNFTLPSSVLEDLNVYVEREVAHGRETERIYVKTTDVDWIKEKFPYAKAVVKLLSRSSKHGESIRYFVASKDFPIPF
jgi:predicted transposase YbfD/YdcC